jgi:anti-anti-sigma factor
MGLAILEDGFPPVLHVRGDIDLATADELRLELETSLFTHPTLVVDMAEVTFIDAAGLRAILAVAESLNGAGPLTLRNAHRVSRLLKMVGLTGLACVDVRDAK